MRRSLRAGDVGLTTLDVVGLVVAVIVAGVVSDLLARLRSLPFLPTRINGMTRMNTDARG